MWTPGESSRISFGLHLVQSQQVIHYWPLRFDLLEKQGKKLREKELKVVLNPNKCVLLIMYSLLVIYVPDHPVGHKQGHPTH